MSRPLPDPPRIDRWPHAVRSAELLSGALVRCGPGLRPVGWPEHPRVRTAALAPWLESGCTAIEMTAAWVWGACHWRDAHLCVSLPAARRKPAPLPSDPSLRRLSLRPDDTVEFQGLAVTGPLRTAFDLAHRSGPLDAATRAACRALVSRAPGGTDALLEMCAIRRYPGRGLAAERIGAGFPAEE